MVMRLQHSFDLFDLRLLLTRGNEKHLIIILY